ncbi:putative tRNA adenosine deaminase-associated protein [Streptomyces sp. DvalAA-43]|jgi:putative tRNA adenosine deaminase-associated protein|nr:putative tRNA adenosine deaminase-associated protein [Streptomyces sp. DvalAA-43]
MADATAELLSRSPCFCHDSDGRDAGQPGHRLPSRRTDTPMTSGRVTVYFAALLARTEDGWEASDTELDDVETLSDLTDLAREASVDEDTVLVFIEQEDAWFGVVRVDGEDDPRIFVSDATAAARSSYGEILLTDELLGREPGAEDTIAALEELVGLDETEDDDPDTTPDNDTTDHDDNDDDGLDTDADAVPSGPLGDTRLLADLGLPEAELLMLRTDALVEIADALGAAEVLETVR